MLKRLLLISFICLIYVSSFVSADATSGTIKQNSVIECDGKYYGSHGIPKH